MDDGKIEKIMNTIGKETVPSEVYKMAEDISRDFSETLTGPEHHVWFAHIAPGKIRRLAVAAVILFAFAIGFSVGRLSKPAQPVPVGVEVIAGESAALMYPSAAASEDSFWRQKALAAMQPRIYAWDRFSEISSLDAYKQYLKEKRND